jgi:hypothetical protein
MIFLSQDIKNDLVTIVIVIKIGRKAENQILRYSR